MSKDQRVHQESRRKFVKTVAYVTPVILTLKAIPSFASGGSGYNGDSQSSVYNGEVSNGNGRQKRYNSGGQQSQQ